MSERRETWAKCLSNRCGCPPGEGCAVERALMEANNEGNRTTDDRWLARRRAAFATERMKWIFIVETFWQLPADRLFDRIKQCSSFDELYEDAKRERDGMIAT